MGRDADERTRMPGRHRLSPGIRAKRVKTRMKQRLLEAGMVSPLPAP
jgi:hypothetical protein